MNAPNQYIVLLQEQLRKLFHQPLGVEVIHDLRVVVKKLRALWIIHPIGSTIPFKTSFPTLRKLFKGAAKTRDLQMALSCLESLPDFIKFPEISILLRKEIKQQQKKLECLLSHQKFRAEVLEDTHRFKAYYKITSGSILKKNRKDYRNDVGQNLNDLNPKFPDKLHDLRKVLKNYMYQSAAFHSDHEHRKQIPPQKSLETFQKDLGNWHDWWNTNEWLEIKRTTIAIHGIDELLKQVKSKEALLKREMIRNIKLALKTISPWKPME